MDKFDKIDNRIIDMLYKDASISVPKLSRAIQSNAPLVYSRIRRLLKMGYINKYTIEVNEELLGYSVLAITGINVDPTFRQNIIKELLAKELVRRVTEVTGRFDILIELRSKSINELHEFISSHISRIAGIRYTETFIGMKKRARDPIFSI